MKVKGIITEDFVNYKIPSLTIETPYCKGFKCDRECGMPVCQNGALANMPTLDYSIDSIIELYQKTPFTHAIVFQGLEPFDTFEDLYDFLFVFRECYLIKDDVVIYTGYYDDEIEDQLNQLKHFSNVIVKFGRYIPNMDSQFDEVLGVKLASPNQYAERIS